MAAPSVGDVIRHLRTGEEGRIVRTVNLSDVLRDTNGKPGKDLGYIVSLSQGLCVPAREALWSQSDVASQTPRQSSKSGKSDGE